LPDFELELDGVDAASFEQHVAQIERRLDHHLSAADVLVGHAQHRVVATQRQSHASLQLDCPRRSAGKLGRLENQKRRFGTTGFAAFRRIHCKPRQRQSEIGLEHSNEV
jgi:hypothetical protein